MYTRMYIHSVLMCVLSEGVYHCGPAKFGMFSERKQQWLLPNQHSFEQSLQNMESFPVYTNDTVCVCVYVLGTGELSH